MFGGFCLLFFVFFFFQAEDGIRDLVRSRGLGDVYKRQGFAYIHIFSPCPTGWGHETDQTIEVARKAVKSNFFPLFEVEQGKWKLLDNKNPIPVSDLLNLLRKFSHLSPDDIAQIQELVDKRMDLLRKLSAA